MKHLLAFDMIIKSLATCQKVRNPTELKFMYRKVLQWNKRYWYAIFTAQIPSRFLQSRVFETELSEIRQKKYIAVFVTREEDKTCG